MCCYQSFEVYSLDRDFIIYGACFFADLWAVKMWFVLLFPLFHKDYNYVISKINFVWMLHLSKYLHLVKQLRWNYL